MEQQQHQISEIAPADRAPAAATAERPAARALGALRALGPARLAALGAVAVALLGFFAYLVLRVGATEYTLLYTGLDLEDSAGIVARLEAMGVPFELRGDGGTILVPSERARRLRMALAEEGLPRGGAVGYEIFDSTGALGTTSFLADINLKRAREGELARTITALDGVRAARVHLVLPKRELFRRDRVEPSASVVLRMAGAGGGARLGQRQVFAVQQLIAAAVPNLRPERVAVVDERGTLLARGGGSDDGEGAEVLLPARAEEFKAGYETRLKRTIEELLERSLGPGRVRAEVSAEIDFDRIQTTSESFDPDSQVTRSTQTIDEETRAAERDTDDAVSVATNLPNAGGALGGGSSRNEQTSRSEEIVNYEISRTVRNHTQVGGRVRRLSVAVLVDGTYVPNAAGERVYTPRGDGELAQIAALVRSAAGFDAGRGDVVEVINMPFAAPEPIEMAEGEGWGGLDAADLRRLAEILVLALLGALLILFVLRPTLNRLLPAPPEARPAVLAGAAAGTEGAPALPPAGDGARPALIAGEPGPARIGEDGALVQEERLIELHHVEGQVRASVLQQVAEFIEGSPDEAVSIVRGWLYES